jgi:hypothetical protein
VTPAGLPAVRTVVFRGWLWNTCTLMMITDARSSKLQVQPASPLHGGGGLRPYPPALWYQICHPTLHPMTTRTGTRLSQPPLFSPSPHPPRSSLPSPAGHRGAEAVRDRVVPRKDPRAVPHQGRRARRLSRRTEPEAVPRTGDGLARPERQRAGAV